jgi:phenylalanine-4-hydroxylase
MIQNYIDYTEEDIVVWRTLFERQMATLQDKACLEFLFALEKMKELINPNSLPQIEKINDWFKTSTGWTIENKPGLIPVDEFFESLSQRKFYTTSRLRKMDLLDHLEEPDMFHDIFGHIPLLSLTIYSEFMFKFGQLGVQFKHNPEKQHQLMHLYWLTIKFGLINQFGLKIYGAGIISSFKESKNSISKKSKHIPFDIETILESSFKSDGIKNTYFVINSFEELFDIILDLSKTWRENELAPIRQSIRF